MARPFDFTSSVRSQARLRQNGLCACCGDALDDLEEHAHHVIPNQSGDARNPRHSWLSAAENCVVLCAVCHDRVHEDGRFRTGAVAPPSYYPWSHGGNRAAHNTWSIALNHKSRSVWNR
jgi:5-methylcytosine-specific restriction endonuclease McrA